MADLFPSLPLSSWGERLAGWRQAGRLRPALAVAGAVLSVAVVVALGAAFLRSSVPAPRLTLPRAQPGSAPADGAGGVAGPAPAPASSPAPATATVYVAGQVRGPGLYAVAAGGRVADAITAAGGTTAEADVEVLNLAERVSDGERIYVPKKGETPPAVISTGGAPAAGAAAGGAGAGAGKAGPAGEPVNLNTATAEQLDALPGVGPATSRAILAYRSSRGRFRSVTELLEVPGIGPAKLEALRPLVKV